MSEIQKVDFPSYLRESFEATLEKVNKKLRKIKGTTDVSILEEKEYKRHIGENAYLEPIFVDFTEVTFEMPGSVKQRGFEFVGTVSKKDSVKTIFAPSGQNLTDIDTMTCDHCGQNRKRNHVHVFNKTKSGERFIVASKCVENYFGIEVFKALNIFKGFVDAVSSEWDEDDIRGSARTYGSFRSEVISVAVAMFENSNVYTKGDYYNGGTSTAQDAKDILRQNPATTKSPRQEEVEKLLVSTYATLDAEASNFNSNIVNVLFNSGKGLREFIPTKGIGILVWAIFNALNKDAKAKAPKAVNTHIGTVGGKVTVKDAVVKSFKEMGSFSYNGPTSFLITFDTPEGQVKTFSTNRDITRLAVGDTVTLAGKVKAHEDWKGFKSTMLNYTKLVEVAVTAD